MKQCKLQRKECMSNGIYNVFGWCCLTCHTFQIRNENKNQNKTINLINDGEVNMLKDAGLTDISFEAVIPHVKYPYAIYPSGFKAADFYLNKFEQLKTSKKPFQFICSRVSPSRKLLFDTNIKVSLEDYRIKEDALDGQELKVSVKLKQYKDYGTKLVNIKIQQQAAVQVASATVQKPRPAETAPKLKTYTVKRGYSMGNSKEIFGEW